MEMRTKSIVVSPEPAISIAQAINPEGLRNSGVQPGIRGSYANDGGGPQNEATCLKPAGYATNRALSAKLTARPLETLTPSRFVPEEIECVGIVSRRDTCRLATHSTLSRTPAPHQRSSFCGLQQTLAANVDVFRLLPEKV